MSSSSWSLSLRPTVDTRNLCATGPPAFGAITDAEEDAGETIIDHIMNPTQTWRCKGVLAMQNAKLKTPKTPPAACVTSTTGYHGKRESNSNSTAVSREKQ